MNRLWALLGLLLAVLALGAGCAPVTPAEVQEQQGYLSGVRQGPNQMSFIEAPGGFYPDNPGVPGITLPSPDISVTGGTSCVCHLEVYDNGGLVCVRMRCNEGCSPHTQACATLFGGCTTR